LSEPAGAASMTVGEAAQGWTVTQGRQGGEASLLTASAVGRGRRGGHQWDEASSACRYGSCWGRRRESPPAPARGYPIRVSGRPILLDVRAERSYTRANKGGTVCWCIAVHVG
jgi:hypothetical protein